MLGSALNPHEFREPAKHPDDVSLTILLRPLCKPPVILRLQGLVVAEQDANLVSENDGNGRGILLLLNKSNYSVQAQLFPNVLLSCLRVCQECILDVLHSDLVKAGTIATGRGRAGTTQEKKGECRDYEESNVHGVPT